jgi:hypothetical protein
MQKLDSNTVHEKRKRKMLKSYRKCNLCKRLRSETKRKILFICFANGCVNHAKRVAFRIHFALQRKKIQAKKGTLPLLFAVIKIYLNTAYS